MTDCDRQTDQSENPGMPIVCCCAVKRIDGRSCWAWESSSVSAAPSNNERERGGEADVDQDLALFDMCRVVVVGVDVTCPCSR